jgi:prepilin-type N-terminal cleavage/methylation domain-containing protein
MRPLGQKGLTLIELLVALAILALIAGAASALLDSALHAQGQGEARSALNQEGLTAMERMVRKVQLSTYVLIPNAHKSTRTILALSGFVNNDNDYYFGDPLFPRIDEDPQGDMNKDSSPGIKGIDDNGDGMVDNAATGDDDEDGLTDEDPLDGIDNDGDGNFDEDFSLDNTGDSKAGIAGVDDDGDGDVDEGAGLDNDEDGSFGEDPLDPLLYLFDPGAGTLSEVLAGGGQPVQLAGHVTDFQVTSGTSNCILITLTLTGDNGEGITFSEYVFPRNSLQRTGKRVR